MSKTAIFPALTLIVTLVALEAAGVAYLHVKFASKEYVKESNLTTAERISDMKKDFSSRLNRIDSKLDKLLEAR